jgi:hypothetical protein
VINFPIPGKAPVSMVRIDYFKVLNGCHVPAEKASTVSRKSSSVYENEEPMVILDNRGVSIGFFA